MRWDIGIDLGTRNVRMVAEGAGEALRNRRRWPRAKGKKRPSPLATRPWRSTAARARGMEVCFPLSDGTLRNGEHARALFGWLYASPARRGAQGRMRALITCAPFARPVQQDALLRAALDAGAAEAGLLRADAAMPWARGSTYSRRRPRCWWTWGAGKISATLFTRGLVAAYAYLPYGVSRVDERLARLLRTERGFLIGPKTAEDVKIALAAAGNSAPRCHARGRAEPANAPADALRRGAGDGAPRHRGRARRAAGHGGLGGGQRPRGTGAD